RVGTHQRHRLAILGDGADRSADVGPAQEDPEAEHRDERDRERDQARAGEEHAADLEDRECRADGLVVCRPEERRERPEEREDAAQEDAVHRRFEEEDRVDHSPTYAFRTKSCSDSSAARPSILIRPTSSRYARSTSFSTWRTFCSTTRIV